MRGANEYASIFREGQHGKLFLVPSDHARGRTFLIYVLPEGVKVKDGDKPWLKEYDAVEVYGIRGGQPGWTEWYGWLHEGPWVQDFEELIIKRKDEIAQRNAENIENKKQREADDKSIVDGLLAKY